MAASGDVAAPKAEGEGPAAAATAPATAPASAPAAASAAAGAAKKRPAPNGAAGDAKRQRADFAVGDRGVFFTTVTPGGAGNAKRDLQRLLETAMEDPKTSTPGSGEGSAGARLEDELKELKAAKPTLVACSEVAKGTGFLKFAGDAQSMAPSKVVSAMLEMQRADYQATRMAMSSKLLCRILPIDYTCKPFVDDFRKLAKEVLPSHVGPEAEPTVWALEFKARNTNTLKKEAVLEVVDEIVPKGRHKVNIGNPAKCILVEVNPLFCGLSIVEHWAKLKKYNLSALTSPETESKGAPAGEAAKTTPVKAAAEGLSTAAAAAEEPKATKE